MPTVGERKFGYKPEDISAAEQYSTETGLPIDYEEGYEEAGQTTMYKKIKKTGSSLYKMKGHTLPGIKQK